MKKWFKVLITLVWVLFFSSSYADETITLVTGVDTATMLVAPLDTSTLGIPGGGGPFPFFTPADFASADAGPNAVLVNNSLPAGWVSSLPINPAAQWISNTDVRLTQLSVLYAFPFTITETDITAAFITVYFAVDNFLGDNDGTINGPNESVYINGSAIGAIEGGGLDQQYQTMRIDITSFVNTGANTLYLYNLNNVDFGHWSGLMAHSVIDVLGPQAVPTLSGWAILLLTVLLGLFGVVRTKQLT